MLLLLFQFWPATLLNIDILPAEAAMLSELKPLPTLCLPFISDVPVEETGPPL